MIKVYSCGKDFINDNSNFLNINKYMSSFFYLDAELFINPNKERIIKIELNKRKYLKFRNSIYLCEYVENKINGTNDKFYLFIDEVQLTNIVKDEDSGIDVTIYDMLNELKGYKNLD